MAVRPCAASLSCRSDHPWAPCLGVARGCTRGSRERWSRVGIGPGREGEQMSQSEMFQPGTEALLRTLHERPQLPLGKWLQAPAHVHYKAFRMSDPPTQRPASRSEFQSLLGYFK